MCRASTPSIIPPAWGSGSYLGSQIKFYGYNLKKLKDITAEVERTLRRNPRIKDVMITSDRYGWWRGESRESILKIDLAKLRAYDVDPAYLYGYIQTLLRGNFGTTPKIQTGGKEIAVSVKFPDAEALDLRGVKESLTPDSEGRIPPSRRDRHVRRAADRRLDRPGKPAIPADRLLGIPRSAEGRGAISERRLRQPPSPGGIYRLDGAGRFHDRKRDGSDLVGHCHFPGPDFHDHRRACSSPSSSRSSSF